MSALVRRGRRVPRDPEVSVIIPHLDRADLLLPCLSSLSRLEGVSGPEIVVVANGTPAEGLAQFRGREDIVLVSSPVNLGFAGGCNWGARFARGRHLVFLNDDIEVEPGWLAALLSVVAGDERIGAVGGSSVSFDGVLQEAGCVLWSNGETHRLGRGSPPPSQATGGHPDVDYCSACALLVTRVGWEAVGGFDENFYPGYYEDVDLCLSLRAHGFRTVCAAGARVRHHEGASTDMAHRLMVAGRSRRYFVEKWGGALGGYEPWPAPGRLEEAVVAAAKRTAERPLPPPSPGRRQRTASRQPTEAEALRLQFHAACQELDLKAATLGQFARELTAKDEQLALQATELAELRRHVELRDESFNLLTAELAQFRRDHERVERLRSVIRRVPMGGRVATRLAHLARANGQRHPEADVRDIAPHGGGQE